MRVEIALPVRQARAGEIGGGLIIKLLANVHRPAHRPFRETGAGAHLVREGSNCKLCR